MATSIFSPSGWRWVSPYLRQNLLRVTQSSSRVFNRSASKRMYHPPPSSKLARSYVHGVSPYPLLSETVGENFDRTASLYPDLDALIVKHQQVRLTWKQLQEHVDNFAAGLVEIGLKKGDRLGIWSPNNVEWVITQFATAKTGIILVNINPAYRLSELEYSLNKVGCWGIILTEKFKSSNYFEMLNSLAPEISDCKPGQTKSKRLPHLEYVIAIPSHTPSSAHYTSPSATAASSYLSASCSVPRGMFAFNDILSLGSRVSKDGLNSVFSTLQFDDPINIQFTSGTTGFPKGAVLSHHNILNNGYFVGNRLRYSPSDRVCIPVPLYHCFGMVLGNMACITHGATMVYPGEGFDPLQTLQTLSEERCTSNYGVPTMMISELNHPDFKKFDLSSLHTGILAGAPCPMELMKRVIKEMHMRDVTICYGMTETSPVSLQTSPTDSIERKVGTVGTILPHLEVKIVDANGYVVPPNTAGELCTRGYSVMLGYWADEKKTAEAIDNARWMHTGDLAVMDQDGYVSIVGRLKDMIIRGGENIYPREIEEFLYKHPKVEDISVIGVPDEKFGEEVCVWVKLKQGMECAPEEIRDFCKGQIAHYKIPSYVHFVEAFPATVTGKIQKFKMRDEFHELIKGGKVQKVK